MASTQQQHHEELQGLIAIPHIELETQLLQLIDAQQGLSGIPQFS